MSYPELQAKFAEIGDLNHALGMVSWDEAVMMPVGGGSRRAASIATLTGLIHERVGADEVGELVAACEGDAGLDEWQAANVAEIERAWIRARAVPNDLVIEASRATSECEQRWRSARDENDWQSIRAPLERVIELTRQRAQCLADALNTSPYDALVDEYEAGIGAAFIDPIFDELKQELPPLIDAALGSQSHARLPEGPFLQAAQTELAKKLMTSLGFDFDRGRLDASHHPFSGGDPDDSRITTRYNEENFLESMFAVLHETGHAMYEQGLPVAWRGQPVGGSGGMALHESQSLFVEMQVCRGRAFFEFTAPIIRETLAGTQDAGAQWSTDNLHALATRVERGLIRVDADELTYPLHVILRYELEKDLLSGRLSVADVPEAWDAGMRAVLGLSTAGDFANGCMQDVHWFAGLIGYFPTYTLGALTAAQFFAAARRDLPGLDGDFAGGDFSAVFGWLREHVHGRGRLRGTPEIVEAATGAPLGTAAFLDHAKARYRSG